MSFLHVTSLDSRWLHLPLSFHPVFPISFLPADHLLLRVYHQLLTWSQYQSRERVTFALSAAILFTCLRERPSMVRGVFGKIAKSVLK